MIKSCFPDRVSHPMPLWFITFNLFVSRFCDFSFLFESIFLDLLTTNWPPNRQTAYRFRSRKEIFTRTKATTNRLHRYYFVFMFSDFQLIQVDPYHFLCWPAAVELINEVTFTALCTDMLYALVHRNDLKLYFMFGKFFYCNWNSSGGKKCLSIVELVFELLSRGMWIWSFTELLQDRTEISLILIPFLTPTLTLIFPSTEPLKRLIWISSLLSCKVQNSSPTRTRPTQDWHNFNFDLREACVFINWSFFFGSAKKLLCFDSLKRKQTKKSSARQLIELSSSETSTHFDLFFCINSATARYLWLSVCQLLF